MQHEMKTGILPLILEPVSPDRYTIDRRVVTALLPLSYAPGIICSFKICVTSVLMHGTNPDP